MYSYNLLQAFSQSRVQIFKLFKPEWGLRFTEGHWNVRRLNKDVEINFACNFRDRLYANMDELYSQVPQEETDPYGYGDETIYDSICYYRSPVSCISCRKPKSLPCLQNMFTAGWSDWCRWKTHKHFERAVPNRKKLLDCARIDQPRFLLFTSRPHYFWRCRIAFFCSEGWPWLFLLVVFYGSLHAGSLSRALCAFGRIQEVRWVWKDWRRQVLPRRRNRLAELREVCCSATDGSG